MSACLELDVLRSILAVALGKRFIVGMWVRDFYKKVGLLVLLWYTMP